MDKDDSLTNEEKNLLFDQGEAVSLSKKRNYRVRMTWDNIIHDQSPLTAVFDIEAGPKIVDRSPLPTE